MKLHELQTQCSGIISSARRLSPTGCFETVDGWWIMEIQATAPYLSRQFGHSSGLNTEAKAENNTLWLLWPQKEKMSNWCCNICPGEAGSDEEERIMWRCAPLCVAVSSCYRRLLESVHHPTHHIPTVDALKIPNVRLRLENVRASLETPGWDLHNLSTFSFHSHRRSMHVIMCLLQRVLL